MLTATFALVCPTPTFRRHYERIHLVPGESKAVVFELSAHDLAEVSEDGKVLPVVGDWRVRVGSAAPVAVSVVS